MFVRATTLSRKNLEGSPRAQLRSREPGTPSPLPISTNTSRFSAEIFNATSCFNAALPSPQTYYSTPTLEMGMLQSIPGSSCNLPADLV